MKRSVALLSIIAAFMLGGCAQQYLSWQGGRVNPGSVEGGAVKRIEGIDFWEAGTPNRPYVIVGLIQDERPVGPLFMMQRTPQLAALAREKGADAVILKSSSSEMAGAIGLNPTMPVGYMRISGATAIYRKSIEYLAVKYVN